MGGVRGVERGPQLEINRDNPLGHLGRVAEQFADMVIQLWCVRPLVLFVLAGGGDSGGCSPGRASTPCTLPCGWRAAPSPGSLDRRSCTHARSGVKQTVGEFEPRFAGYQQQVWRKGGWAARGASGRCAAGAGRAVDGGVDKALMSAGAMF